MGEGYYSSKVIFVWSRGLSPTNRANRLNLQNKSKRPNLITENRVFQKYDWVDYVVLRRSRGLVTEICPLICTDLIRYMCKYKL